MRMMVTALIKDMCATRSRILLWGLVAVANKRPFHFCEFRVCDETTVACCSWARENEASLNFPLQMMQRWVDASNIGTGVNRGCRGRIQGSPPTSDIRMSPSIDVIKRKKGSCPDATIGYFDHEFEELGLQLVGWKMCGA